MLIIFLIVLKHLHAVWRCNMEHSWHVSNTFWFGVSQTFYPITRDFKILNSAINSNHDIKTKVFVTENVTLIIYSLWLSCAKPIQTIVKFDVFPSLTGVLDLWIVWYFPGNVYKKTKYNCENEITLQPLLYSRDVKFDLLVPQPTKYTHSNGVSVNGCPLFQ